MPNPKLWLKTSLERLLLSSACVTTELLQRGGDHEFEIIIPHRVNWPLLNATLRAFDRLTTGNFGITVVVNFDEVPATWAGKGNPRVTLLRNRFTAFGALLRRVFSSENGSMSNALGIEQGLKAHPRIQWAFMAHSDSAPLVKGWNEIFFRAMGTGLIFGNTRDSIRMQAAHAAGTLFQAQEFFRRGGTVWPLYRFGEMIRDVGDGATLALHPELAGPVPVLENNRQQPALNARLSGTIAEFAENGSHISFEPGSDIPIFAHLGRGTPRSRGESQMAQKLPVDHWIDYLETLR